MNYNNLGKLVLNLGLKPLVSGLQSGIATVCVETVSLYSLCFNKMSTSVIGSFISIFCLWYCNLSMLLSSWITGPFALISVIGYSLWKRSTQWTVDSCCGVIDASSSAFVDAGLNARHVQLAFRVFCLYENIKARQSHVSRLLPILQFLESYCSMEEAIHTLHNVLIVIEDDDDDDLHYEPQGVDTFLDSAQETMNNWERVSESEFVLKIQKMLQCVLYSSLAREFGFSPTSSALKHVIGKCPELKFMSPNAFAFSVADALLTFAKVGHECFIRGDLQPLYISDRVAREWHDDYMSVINTLNARPITESFEASKMVNKMDSVITKGLPLMKTHGITISPLWRSLMDRRTRLVQEVGVSSTRKAPFSVLLYGPPGQGKSSVTQLIAKIYHQAVTREGIYDIDWDPVNNMYTHNSNDEYFSGYKGAQHWFIVLDDIARENKNIVASGKTTYASDLLTMVNDVGVATNQAAIEDKGTIPLVPKLVVATSNVKDLNVAYSSAEPTAVLRRLPYIIEPVLKSEFKNPDTGIMKKLDHVERDAWLFKVETYKIDIIDGVPRGSYLRYDPDGDQSYRLITCAELCIYLKSKILEHEKSSQVMYDSLKKDNSLTSCEHGTLSYYECPQCVEAQTFSFNPLKHYYDYKRDLGIVDRGIVWSIRKSLSSNTCVVHAQYCAYIMGHFDNGPSLVAHAHRQHYEEKLPNKVQVGRLLFGISSLLALYKVLTMLMRSPTPSSVDDSPKCQPQSENIWGLGLQNELFKVPRKSKDGNLLELEATVRKSLFCLHVRNKTIPQSVYAFQVSPGVFCTVAHAFDPSQNEWQCIADNCKGVKLLRSEQGFTLSKDNCIFLPNDVAVFRAVLLPRKSLIGFLPKNEDCAGRMCRLVSPRDMEPGHVRTIDLTNVPYPSPYGTTISGKFMSGYRIDRSPTKGDCGSLILSQSETRGWYISGMHCAGSPPACGLNRIVVTQLSQSMFDGVGPIVPMSEPGDFDKFVAGSKLSGPLGIPYRKGVHCWASGCKAELLGSYPRGVTHKSRVRETKISSDYQKLTGEEICFGAPLMMPRQDDSGTWLNPFTIAAEQQGRFSPLVDASDVMDCARAFLQETTQDSTWLLDVRNHNLEDAINGVDGDSYVNSIPMSTSGGFFYPGPKREYFSIDCVTGKYIPCGDLLSHVRDMEVEYSLGNRCRPVFNATLKDEPLKLSKVESGKTRVFTACDIAFSLVCRKQYLGIIKAIMSNNILTECMVGLNHYCDWGMVYAHLVKFGPDKIVAGDYGNYDKGMPPIFILAAFWLLDQWRSFHMPLSPADSVISRGIATDVAFPVINVNKELVQFYGGNPSGHPLTSIVNSIANSLFMRFAYKKLGYCLSTFKQNVSLVTYGDDNAFGSNLPDFNHSSVSTILREYGIVYTMPDKTSASIPFVHIDDIDFLKRGFRVLNGRMVAPLALSSINKSLCLWVAKDTISEDERLAQCYGAARREWALHGEGVFNHYVSIMESLLCTDPYRDICAYLLPCDHLPFDEFFEYMFENYSDDDSNVSSNWSSRAVWDSGDEL